VQGSCRAIGSDNGAVIRVVLYEQWMGRGAWVLAPMSAGLIVRKEIKNARGEGGSKPLYIFPCEIREFSARGPSVLAC
jgi:hypothetical protein